jgi:transcriptional regulator with XRE-family HTH domain
MYNSSSFAERLLLARRHSGLDQKELGRRASVSNTYISDLERGRVTNPGIEVVFSLAEALNVPVVDLLGIEVDIPELDEENLPAYLTGTHLVHRIDHPYTRNMAKRFLELFLALPQRDQDLLLRMAETIAASNQPRIIGEEEKNENGSQ